MGGGVTGGVWELRCAEDGQTPLPPPPPPVRTRCQQLQAQDAQRRRRVDAGKPSGATGGVAHCRQQAAGSRCRQFSTGQRRQQQCPQGLSPPGSPRQSLWCSTLPHPLPAPYAHPVPPLAFSQSRRSCSRCNSLPGRHRCARGRGRPCVRAGGRATGAGGFSGRDRVGRSSGTATCGSQKRQHAGGTHARTHARTHLMRR